MWVDPRRPDAIQNIRHQAEQRDGLSQYGWVAHDGECFGRQRLIDGRFNISTSFIKKVDDDEDEESDWAVRIAAGESIASKTVDQREEEQQQEEQRNKNQISFFFYIATEDGSPVTIHTADVLKALHHNTVVPAMSGSTTLFGAWSLHMNINEEEENHRHQNSFTPPTTTANFMGLRTPHLHNLTEAVQIGMYHSLYQQHNAEGQQNQQHHHRQLTLTLPNLIQQDANVAIIQITAQLPFTIDFDFSTGGDAKIDRSSSSVGKILSEKLSTAESAFNARFSATFGTLSTSDDSSLPVGTEAVSKAALSNLLGGIGYWYGHSLVKLPKTINNMRNSDRESIIVPLWDTPLFSATPSRPFFPRGFLWDEGFHQLLVRRWSPALSRDCLAHWLDVMTASGWIPREQILGEESRARVPAQFIPQSPDAANPPALFLTLADMAQQWVDDDDDVQNNSDVQNEDVQFLQAAWPRLYAWFQWYNTSQAGPLPGSYRWRGREQEQFDSTIVELNPKTLTSGLDDYPRASHPSTEERHLDLRCWMALAAHSLSSVGAAVGAPGEQIAALRATAARLRDFDELKRLHWDADRGVFADWGVHTESVTLVDRFVPSTGEIQKVRVLTDAENDPPRPQFVPHYGYVSLFPLMLGMIPHDAHELGQQLQRLAEREELWSDHGLRSLSKSSSLYGKHNTEHDAPYWRGAVWVNINYLVLRSLRRYEMGGGPHAVAAGEAAGALRAALLDNLVGQYNERGYLFEQYDDGSGQGKGSHPFTGWTALLTLISSSE